MRVLRPGARIVFIRVWPVLKSLPPIGTPLRSASSIMHGQVAAQVRCAVGVRHAAHDRGVRVDLARADHRRRCRRGPARTPRRVWCTVGRLAVRLGRSAPHHHEPVAAVLGPEALDVGHQRLGQVHLVGAGLDPDAVEAARPSPGRTPRPWRRCPRARPRSAPRSRSSSTPAVRAASSALAEIGSQPPNTRSSSEASGTKSLISGLRPSARLAEADVGHLGERADRRFARLGGPAITPAMRVEATAPRPGSSTPSLPVAGAIWRGSGMLLILSDLVGACVERAAWN